MQRRLSAILAADVVNYSRLMGADQTGTLGALREMRKTVFEPVVAGHRGTIIKRMGDGWLVEFTSVSDAVDCALRVQERLKGHDLLRLRIGIHIGEVIFEEEDIYGDGVNIAARLEALADPGGVLISDSTRNSLDGKAASIFADGGVQTLKNIARPVQVWRWKKMDAAFNEQAEAPVLPEKPSIAVLPFTNMSGDPEQEYFADGISEDIITELARIEHLFVIARNTTFTFKGKSHDIPSVAKELGVHFVLEGSVRKAGDRLRITAQLINGKSGGHAWAERYDRDLADIFDVQDDVTDKIVKALKVSLVGAEELPERAETAVPEAYDCVLRGREQYRLFTKEGLANARALYEEAARIDPAYAAPYAGLAEVCRHEWFLGEAGAIDKTIEYALKAASLNPDLPLVYEALGSAYLFTGRHDEAIAAFMRWIELEPNSAEAYANLAGAYVFNGDPEKVHDLIDIASRLNPVYPFYYPLYRGQAYFLMSRYEEAANFTRRAADLNPASPHPPMCLAASLAMLGRNDEAGAAVAATYAIIPDARLGSLGENLPFRRSADLDHLLGGMRKAGFME
ncbi:adenylate/guanylate cyclase domain-containing protein [Sneathiella sp.]|uniref:adenylate/guanylate cyclase domain-containing protein n=1 Tax=Sneathiella sp. TaxID=1964365 RepID=UPI00262E0AE6|nr:adenylate/guanylate cyclase domain-containing protein [Sneathiella sp.]MDF2369064.1 adenylate/guanylate cyclase domain-containing protein [Sneathiella sp.]